MDSFTDAKLVQYYALYCIYNATNKVPNPITDAEPAFQSLSTFPGWISSTGWEETDLDPCDGWFGIDCDTEGRVVEFTMVENLMTGSFPPELVLLASDGPFATGAGFLNYFEVYNNPFLFNNGNSSWMTNLGSNLRTCEHVNTQLVHRYLGLSISYSIFLCSQNSCTQASQGLLEIFPRCHRDLLKLTLLIA